MLELRLTTLQPPPRRSFQNENQLKIGSDISWPKRQPTVPNESFVSSIVPKQYAIVSGARFIVLRLWRQTAIRWILETFQSFHR